MEPSPPETVVPIVPTPGSVKVELRGLDALFDRAAPPTYPHSAPMLNRSVANFLVDATREQRSHSTVEVVLSLDGSPLPLEEEETARTQIHRFFSNETELAALDVRVNRSEGLGSLRYAFPLVVLAGILVALGSSDVWPGAASYLLELTTVIFVIVVWVLLWDPIEKLLFDSYILRLRLRALRKLAKAPVRFEYGAHLTR